MFLWPTTTKRVTSHFRPPHRKGHHGLDIAKPGTHEIYASADGTVTRSYTSSSYGECIFILHNINGQTYETVYAHMRAGSRRFKVGQKVSKGQTIGIMGNTGHSTGQHLHFEIHKGRWNINKTNAVDPLKYISAKNYLSKSDKGSEVKKMQQDLIKLGYSLGKHGADGDFGDNTDKAVRKFQKDNKLTVDGKVGKATLNAIEKLLKEKEETKVTNKEDHTPDSSHAPGWHKAQKKKGKDGKSIINGKNPQDPLTREQLATVLDRLGLLD